MALVSPSRRQSITEILRSLSETLFWSATAVGLIFFSLSSVFQLLQMRSETFFLFLGLRLTLAALAVAALLWRSVGNELNRMAAPLMMLVVMSERVFELGWLGPDAMSVGSLDCAALLFLAAGAMYRGESRRWWSTLMPWALLNQALLLLELSARAGVKTTDLVQASLIVAIGWIGTCVFFAIRSARVVESQAEFDRGVEPVTSLKEVQEEIRILVGLLTAKEKMAEELAARDQASAVQTASPVSQKEASIENSKSTLETLVAAKPVDELEIEAIPEILSEGQSEEQFEESSEEQLAEETEVSDWRPSNGFHMTSLQVALHYPLASEVPADELLEPSEVFEILKEIVARQGAAIQREWDRLTARERSFKSPTRLSLNAPAESAWPIVIRAKKSFLKAAFHSLLLRAIESSNSSGKGIVRVNFRVGLSQLSISIEDNGRGFSEEKLRAMSFPETFLAGPTVGPTGASLAGATEVLEARPTFIGVSEIREALEESGNLFDFQARLGVGTRAILDFPRLDAYSSEKIRSSKALLGKIETRSL